MHATDRALDVTWVQQSSPRLLLWIDGVGGYLVCLGQRVTIGQVNPEAMPDVALMADIARHHATIERDTEGYALAAIRKVKVNGQPAERCLLRSEDRLTLGASCQLVFTQPARISSSARLDVVSGHRLARPVDAVFLMADTLLLGPRAHVAIDDLAKPVILFRQGQGLGVRYEGTLSVDGAAVKERSPLAPGQRVTADGVTFTLELVK
jgi:hypothetical protein